jgi:hypothetical protein
MAGKLFTRKCALVVFINHVEALDRPSGVDLEYNLICSVLLHNNDNTVMRRKKRQKYRIQLLLEPQDKLE